MSYNNTANHRHNSPNGYLLPINNAVVAVDNDYREGYVQPLLFEGASTSSPDDSGPVIEVSLSITLQMAPSLHLHPPGIRQWRNRPLSQPS